MIACFCGDQYVEDLDNPYDQCPGCGVFSHADQVVVAPHAPPVTFDQAVHHLDDSTREPRLHAFPPGAAVALCGRTRREAEGERVVDGRRCTACVQAASRKGFVTR
jgi:hypothetical protein